MIRSLAHLLALLCTAFGLATPTHMAAAAPATAPHATRDQASPPSRAKPWTMSRGKLRRSKFTNPVAVGKGVTKPYFVDVADPKTGRLHGRAVRKTSSNFNGTPTAHHEVAAYALSQVLGFDLVPPTARIEGDITAQLFVEGQVGGAMDVEGQQLLHLFDYLLQNEDRHAGNFLIAAQGSRVVAIDHSHRVFPPMNKGEFVPYASWYRGHYTRASTTLGPRAMALLAKIDLARTARVLHASGLSVFEARGVLHRSANLRHVGLYGMDADGQGAPADRSRVEALLHAYWGSDADLAPSPSPPSDTPVYLPKAARHGAHRIATPVMPVVARPTIHTNVAAGSVMAVYDVETNRRHDILDLQQYRAIEAVTAPLLQQHPPTDSYFVAVGPRATESLALMNAMGRHFAGYLPIDDGTVGRVPANIPNGAQEELFSLLDIAIPPGILASGRSLVVFDGNPASSSGLSQIAPLVESWAASRGFPGRRVSTAHAPVHHAGMSAVEHDRIRVLLAPSPTLRFDQPVGASQLLVDENGFVRAPNQSWERYATLMYGRAWFSGTLVPGLASR